MEKWPDVGMWLGTLCRSRPVFHSEADFQQALASAIHVSDPSSRIRLETRPAPGMRLDLLVWRPDLSRYLALELKYLTAAWAGQVDGEHFGLLSQGAQDIRAYDVLKDVQRVEQFVDRQPGWSGMVLVLSNDPSYWSRPGHGRATNADAFRIYEDQVISGSRSWGPGTGAGTIRKRRQQAAIELRGDYTCRWTPYSALPGSQGEFRLLAFTVGASGTPPRVPAADSRGVPPEPDPPRIGIAAVSPVAPEPRATAVSGRRYSLGELRAELRRFEHQLRASGLKETSITTYVDRTGRFLRWLEGNYQPRGPN